MTFITHCLIYYLSGQMPLIRIFEADNNTGCNSPLNDWTKLVNQFSHLNLGYGKNTQKLFCGTEASNHPGSGTKRDYSNHS